MGAIQDCLVHFMEGSQMALQSTIYSKKKILKHRSMYFNYIIIPRVILPHTFNVKGHIYAMFFYNVESV